ncbi:Oidioi.mRNA.OKI2018_I69.PAR.g9411.t1.cds [Oikopleura dioica]|uniref:Oidioi.mRNA.OKI2018_I69.PAR.g9411.t1.cds n=1 Tax=Oikopleura dioica TaxID=34765 RepID=A0ABN7RNU7_OIKDI|nr:Oidioi.mRNA.OKI2018_I69.PAR.g9411.t1.cds [Oikopleura dioica]
MREKKDFVFPSSNVTILEKKTKPKEEIFTQEEQEVNLKRCERLNFYDRKVCEKLCVKINEEDDVVCKHICETQLSDHGQTQNICPFQEQCPSGCPCPLYECEHIDTEKVPLAWFYEEGNNLFRTYHGMSVNEFVMLALQNGKPGTFVLNDAVPNPKLNEVFSRLVLINSTNLEIDTIYDRIVFVNEQFSVLGQEMQPKALISYRSDFIEYYERRPMAPLYFKGNHYLVSPDFTTYLIDKKEITDIGVDSELLLNRFGRTNVLIFDGYFSVASVYEDKFFFCSTAKYINFCFFFYPENKANKKPIYKARGSLVNDFGGYNRRHIFEIDGELKLISVNTLAAHNVQIQTLKNENGDWSKMLYEDQRWERDFHNDTFSKSYSTYDVAKNALGHIPYDTIIQDFLPIPDKKGILFVATFRHREFEERPFINPFLQLDDSQFWTKTDYFIILYRYFAGQFVRIGEVKTKFTYGSSQFLPFYKDITSFVQSFQRFFYILHKDIRPFKLI